MSVKSQQSKANEAWLATPPITCPSLANAPLTLNKITASGASIEPREQAIHGEPERACERRRGPMDTDPLEAAFSSLPYWCRGVAVILLLRCVVCDAVMSRHQKGPQAPNAREYQKLP